MVIKKEIQVAVDAYLATIVEEKRVREELDRLRKVIEPYMKDHEVSAIEASDGRGKVELKQQVRATVSARYTTYDLAEVAPMLTPTVRKKCVVDVIDRDKLEALHKLGEVSAEIMEHKVTKLSDIFTARLR